MVLCDSHAHLSQLAERSSGVFEATVAAYSGGGALVIDPGVEYDDFPARKAALGGLAFVRLAAGIWPDRNSMKAVDERVAFLEQQLRDGACAALGECGLDYHWMNGSREEQIALFRAQMELALRYDKPLIVHSREAHGDTLAQVRDCTSKVPVIIHCFGYGAREAEDYLRLGCRLSFAGNLSYKNAAGLREACALVPDSLLLLETDAPYMCPEPRRGKDSSPLDIERTYAVAAALRDTSVERLAALVLDNIGAVLG